MLFEVIREAACDYLRFPLQTHSLWAENAIAPFSADG